MLSGWARGEMAPAGKPPQGHRRRQRVRLAPASFMHDNINSNTQFLKEEGKALDNMRREKQIL